VLSSTLPSQLDDTCTWPFDTRKGRGFVRGAGPVN
jgi:hypothetical protein